MVDVDGESAKVIFKSGLPTKDLPDMMTALAFEVEFVASYLFLVEDPMLPADALGRFDHHLVRWGGVK